MYGYEGIPGEWRETLIKREYIEEMCARAGKAWGKIVYTIEVEMI